MKLIFDAGGSKTAMAIVENHKFSIYEIDGINPVAHKVQEISKVLQNLVVNKNEQYDIDFYGAGCVGGEFNQRIFDALNYVFPHTRSINIYTDLLGACKASVPKSEKGIVGILGTGSSIGLYDGTDILETISGQGFILGDFGSGATLVKSFFTELLFGKLSMEVQQSFVRDTNMSREAILSAVYQNSKPAKSIGYFAKWIFLNQFHDDIAELIDIHFDRYFNYMLQPLLKKHHNHKVYFVGGIAYHFSNFLEELSKKKGFEIGGIIKSPLEVLAKLVY